jgi:hypothetical protein
MTERLTVPSLDPLDYRRAVKFGLRRADGTYSEISATLEPGEIAEPTIEPDGTAALDVIRVR